MLFQRIASGTIGLALTALTACGADGAVKATTPEAEDPSPQTAASTDPKPAPRTPTPHSATPLNKRIDWIRAEYNTVQSSVASNQWSRRALDAARHGYQSAEGVTLAMYCDPAGEPRKMVLTSYGEMGRTEHEVFIDQYTPFFSLRVDLRYDQPGGTVVKRSEHRFYYDGATVVRVIGPDQRSLNNPTGKSAERANKLHQEVMQVMAYPDICGS